MSTVKTIHAVETAKIIRNELKTLYPDIKFSVTTHNQTIRVKWVDGVKWQNVNDYLNNKYRGKWYDGMTETTSYTNTEYNGEQVHFSVGYVSCDRFFSVELMEKFAKFISENYNTINAKTGKSEKPVYEVKYSEFGGAYIVDNDTTMFGGMYFNQYVQHTMNQYNTYEEFLKEKHPEHYNATPETKVFVGDVAKIEKNKVKDSIETITEIVVKLDRNWTWVTGVKREDKNTQQKLKDLGYSFSGKRIAWYTTTNKEQETKEVLGIE